MTPQQSALALFLIFFAASAAAAQTPSSTPAGPAGAFEFSAGYAGFVDDATIDHAVLGIGSRWYLGPRLSIGPEVVYMKGPGGDRDLFLTANLTWDLAGGYGRSPRVIPFIVGGAGLMRHRDRFGSQTFTSSEGAFTAGGGARVRLNDRIFAAGDARIGWELHYRFTGTVGVGFGR
jgi:hypothetical protein